MRKVGQSRRERTWSTPSRTKHAWLREGNHPHDIPRQVYVVSWRRHSYRWFAFIVEAVEIEGATDPVIVQRWVPVSMLRPVAADPNRIYGAR